MPNTANQNQHVITQSNKLLRVKGVLQILPVSRSHFLQGVKDGLYPKPIKLSQRVTCWRESDILALTK